MITNVLFYATLVLDFAGLLFAVVFLWVNLGSGFTDLSERSASALKICKISMVVSIIFSFLTSLLSNGVEIYTAISKSSLLFSIIAITWLAVILACGIVLLFKVISKTSYRASISKAVKQLFGVALPGAIICLVLSWLFS